jgi:hypothetical protein
MAREAEKAGRDSGKAKSEGSPETRAAGGTGKSVANAGAEKAGETSAGKVGVKEFQGERHKELQAALAKRSEDGANMPAIVKEFAAVWLPLHMVEVELLVPEFEDAEVNEDKRASVAVRKDLMNILLADLIRSDEIDGANAKLEALSDVLDAVVVASQQEAEAITAAIDETTLSELGPQMKDRYERLNERFADIDENLEEAMSLLAPRSLWIASRRERSRSQRGRRESEMPRRSSMRDRDEQGRFASDDGRRYSRSGSYRDEQERDAEGRFMSEGRRSRGLYEDEDESRSGGGYGGRRSMGRERDEDDGGRRYGRGSSGEYGSRWSGQGRGREQRGWFGDPEGHSEASRRGWERFEYGESGSYGDREGRSQASRRGWDEGHRSQRRDEDDERYGRRGEGAGRYGRSFGYEDEDRRGDYGGERYESRRGSGRREDDDERNERSGRSGSHGGWSGDPEGHSEAARRGWQNRR